KSPYSFSERSQSPPFAPSLRIILSLTAHPSALPLMTQPSRFLPLKRGTNSSSFSSARRPPASASQPASAIILRLWLYMKSLLFRSVHSAIRGKFDPLAPRPRGVAERAAADRRTVFVPPGVEQGQCDVSV